ncbi:MAG: adenosine deaminase [Tabrizicola sp.]|nr:adenosine deaminase [Tabrizicola sp.]
MPIATDRLRTLPKTEVHVHLEGCFDADTLDRWAHEAGVPMPRPKDRLFAFQELTDFLQFLDWACGLAHTSDRIAQLAYEFAQRLGRDGTLYADLIINPTHWHEWKTRPKALIEALDAGFKAAEADGLPPVGLCISLLRTQSATEATDLVELLTDWRHPRVGALSVDGNEAAAGRTGPKFADAFARAGRAGLKRTVHAGESSGPEGVRDAIELLGADRIDHGVRAIEEPALVDLLARRAIPLGVCPTSNLTLGVYPSLDRHPVDRLRKAGVPISLNTDDPGLLGTDLPSEYALVAQAFDWDEAVAREVARTSIIASFANDDLKSDMLRRLAAW